MKTKSIIATLFIIVAFISSCKKEGPAGPAGTNGVDGNANVVSSTVTVSSWALSGASYYTDIIYPAITSSIINSGAVLVYIQTGTGVWSQLPLTFYASSTYSSTLEVVTAVNLVRILWTDSDLTTPATPGAMTFKIVVIASSTIAQNPNVDYSNYTEVQNTFNIID